MISQAIATTGLLGRHASEPGVLLRHVKAGHRRCQPRELPMAVPSRGEGTAGSVDSALHQICACYTTPFGGSVITEGLCREQVQSLPPDLLG